MCGIFGASSALADAALAQVSRVLAHRGPDSSGQHVEEGASLVHRRLKIIDLSAAAAQPMTNEDRSIWVVFNGEIYNHHALRRELEKAHRFQSHSDTEVLVHGYEAWGDDLVARLDGMFAFGIWDRPRRRFLLARDRTGKKPLFFSTARGVFRFASTVSALHASGLDSGIHLEALPQYLSCGFVPPPATLHAEVEQLPPATLLVREASGAIETRTYWSPRFGERTSDSFAAASDKVRQLVETAVERRLESDVPLGAFLSGGIDSTILVGAMAKRLGSRVRTFSIGFAGDPRYDETHYARIAARAFHTDHTEFTLDPSSFELVEELVRHHDGPFGDSSAIPTYVVSRLTRQHVTVALTGDGGDELFCGYLRFLAAEASERLPLPLRKLAARVTASLPGGASERSLLGRARRFFRASALPLAERMAWWTSYVEPRRLLRPELVRSLGVAIDAPQTWHRDMWGRATGSTTLARVLEHNFRTYLPFDLLIKADRVSMAHGLELRSPFLDTELIEYASSLPASYLRRGRTTKRILKHAFFDLLPEPIRNRGKMGFGVPLGTWFRNDLRAYLHDHLGTSARLFEYLDPRAVQSLLDEHQRGAADHGLRIWMLLTLEIWLRLRAAQPIACAA